MGYMSEVRIYLLFPGLQHPVPFNAESDIELIGIMRGMVTVVVRPQQP